MASPRGFVIGELPRDVYFELQRIRKLEGATARQAVVAAILALGKLWERDRDAVRAVWEETRRLLPDKPTTPDA